MKRLIAGLLLTAACGKSDKQPPGVLDTGSAPDTDTSIGNSWDTAPPIHEPSNPVPDPAWGCSDGPTTNPAELSDPEDHSEGHRYRVVQIATDAFDAYHVVILYPPAAYRNLYDVGAPVVVTSMQSIGIGQAWATEPRSFFPVEFGVVEVQPVHPGWIAVGSATSGTHDGAGPGTAASLAEAIRFSTGKTETVNGYQLRDLVNREICIGKVAVLGASSGGITAATALNNHRVEVGGSILGLTFYETPSLPMFVVGDAGFKSLDRLPAEDTDGNGTVWDEGRNPAFEGCDLNSLDCSLDLKGLAWSGALAPIDIAPTDFAPGANGVLYLDRNDNGQLDLAPDMHPDLNGDGLIGEDEDYFVLPYQTLNGGGEEVQYYSPAVTVAAGAVFGPEVWPPQVASASASLEYWSQRNTISAATEAISELGTSIRFSVAFSTEDHAVPVAERPHVHVLYEALRLADSAVRTNTSLEVAQCLLEETLIEGWAGGGEPGVYLDTEALLQTALPADLPPRAGRALATLGLFWDTWGPFDVCPGELSSR